MNIIRRRINTKLVFVLPLKGTYTISQTSSKIDAIEVSVLDPMGREVYVTRVDSVSSSKYSISITIPATAQKHCGYYSMHISKNGQYHVDFENFLELNGCSTGICEDTTVTMQEVKFGDETCTHIYYGYSNGLPDITEGTINEEYNFSVLSGSSTVSIQTTSSNKCNCHYIAWPKDHTCTIASWKDSDGDDIKELVQYKDICHYRVAYILSNAYIVNTSVINIT